MVLPVDVLADTGRGERLAVRPPPRVWLARVASAPSTPASAPARPPLADAPLPGAAPDAVEWPAPPALDVDPGLKPPLPQARAPLEIPPGSRSGFVELDVQVDERGTVSEARWAGGSADSAHVGAATRCARAMRFYPALRAGRPVAVWCRQRFDFPDGR
ncbi:MAG: hypothetical protein E6K78_00770 [Candidatus Eisenbacteria bacterium]|uniref:TonB C-terminal domain-containing protein n=1 Tax=Eiseniibacteriota bacterium TaxID=2212470 RepID=A0A538TXZ3_UNCEI|nr:MAG: hypothetical protein E6K78_00770 [Candidatus Eisenbacteria bacterium]